VGSRRVGIVAAAALLAGAGLVLALTDDGKPPHREAQPAQARPSTATGPFNKLPSREIMRQVLAATRALKTVHVTTRIEEDDYTAQFDLRRTEDGVCFGGITLNRRTASVIATKKHTYLRGSPAFWRLLKSPGVSTEMASTPRLWARLPENDRLRTLCDVPKLLEKLDLDADALSRLRAGGVYPGVTGRAVVDLTDNQSNVEVTVDVHAPHYLLAVHAYEGDVVLDEFDEPTSVTLPEPGEYVPFRNADVEV
jgi:hypothetical protein